MIKKTTLKFDIEVNDDNTASKEIEYMNYSKTEDNEENLLTYKNIIIHQLFAAHFVIHLLRLKVFNYQISNFLFIDLFLCILAQGYRTFY